MTRGRALGLADNMPCVLYRAVLAGGRKEGLFLYVDPLAWLPVPQEP